MAASAPSRITPAEYLERDRSAEIRHEYVDGRMVAMSGGTPNHSYLIQAIGRELAMALRGRGCNVSVASLRLQVAQSGAYLYPDAMVLCGGAQLAEGTKDTVLNPTVIVEVLSSSTERFDRTGKFALYRQVPTVREYVLISQDEQLVEWYTLRDDGDWAYHAATGPDALCRLASLDIEIPLAQLYDGIQLP